MRTTPRVKALLIGAGMLTLAGAVIVVGIAGAELVIQQLAARGSHRWDTHASLAGTTPTDGSQGVTVATCGVAGKPACPVQVEWFPLSSTAPAVVLATMKQTWIFHVDLSDNGDHIHDLSHLGTPLLIRGLAPKGATMPDLFLLPIKDAQGIITDLGTFELNAQHSALRFTSISGFDGQYPIVRQTVSAAMSAVWNQRHVSLRAHAQPYLIYFPINASDLETGKVIWGGGGLTPSIPLWLVPGGDGRNYVFGNNGKVYEQSELPMSR